MENVNRSKDNTAICGECKQNRNIVPCGDRYPLSRIGARTMPYGECTQSRRQDRALWRVYTEQETGQCLVESVHRTGDRTVPFEECTQNRRQLGQCLVYSVHKTGDRTVPCGECTQNRR